MLPVSRESWPQRIICLATVADPDNSGDQGAVEELTLKSWHAIGLIRNGANYALYRAARGFYKSSWWSGLEDIMRPRGSVWICGYQITTDWALMGVWDEIEKGALKLQTDNGYYAGAGTGAQAPAGTPYIICEDPPNIIRAWHVGTQKALTWVDLQNYGLRLPKSRNSGSDRAEQIVSAIRSVISAVQAAQLGGLQATAASQAMHGFRRSYLRSSIYVHNEPSALAIEDRAYYGGRCEAYYLGVVPRPLYHLDVHSMYAAVYGGAPLPVRLREVLRGRACRRADIFRLFPSSIATVRIRSEEPAYPVRRDHDTIYPIGEYRTTLCGPELLDAYQRGRLLRVYQLAHYDMEDFLHEYANILYGCRQRAEREGCPGSALVLKRLLVSIAGKFGQRERRWIECSHHTADVQWGEWFGADPDGAPCRYRALAGHVCRDYSGGYGYDSSPAIAGWITSAARVKLLNLIRVAGWGQVYYVDTDSLMVDEHGYDRIRAHPNSMGEQLGQCYTTGRPCCTEIRGIKYYIENGQAVCAGLPAGGAAAVAAVGGFARELSVREQIRRGRKPIAQRIYIPYSRSTKYRHGIVTASGRVIPYRLGAKHGEAL